MCTPALTKIWICIGNQMISNGIWEKKAQVNFLKTTKKLQFGNLQFVVFEKFPSAYLFQIDEKNHLITCW